MMGPCRQTGIRLFRAFLGASLLSVIVKLVCSTLVTTAISLEFFNTQASVFSVDIMCTCAAVSASSAKAHECSLICFCHSFKFNFLVQNRLSGV